MPSSDCSANEFTVFMALMATIRSVEMRKLLCLRSLVHSVLMSHKLKVFVIIVAPCAEQNRKEEKIITRFDL